jgi:hypothetical protein
MPIDVPEIRINIPATEQSQSSNAESNSSWGMHSILEDIKSRFWQKLITSNFGFMITRILAYSVLTFSIVCFCLSLLSGNFLFTSISFLAIVMIMLNIELVSLSRKYNEHADLYDSMTGIRDHMQGSSSNLRENNEQLKQELGLLQGKIRKLENLLLGMEKIINDSHNLNRSQATKFTDVLSSIIESTDLTNAAAQEEFAKVLLDYEGMSDRLAVVTTTLELKTAELASASAALSDTNKDFKKVCGSLETITSRLEQLYKVGVISEQYLTNWSLQLKVADTDGPSAYVKSSEIKQDFIGLQSFCDSLGAVPGVMPMRARI